MITSKKAVIFILTALFTVTLYSSNVSAAVYTIVPNDSLYKISVLFNTSVNTLKADNMLTSDNIYPGQTLSLSVEVHTVKSGDTMYLIAKRYGITLYSLQKANNKWDDLLLPGKQLMIPGIKPSNATTQTLISYTPAEVDLLARLINAEAESEFYDAKVAVGAVVVNRVQNPDWPSTITSVIYQKIGEYYQFTPVKNGQISKPATDSSIKAAWAALYGSDPSNDAIFYFDDSSTNQWMWSKPITARIDSMIFAK
jgi:spore germination cell wall hydrolase CwlJ-like protein